jgi:hypothetical protein
MSYFFRMSLREAEQDKKRRCDFSADFSADAHQEKEKGNANDGEFAP